MLDYGEGSRRLKRRARRLSLKEVLKAAEGRLSAVFSSNSEIYAKTKTSRQLETGLLGGGGIPSAGCFQAGCARVLNNLGDSNVGEGGWWGCLLM